MPNETQKRRREQRHQLQREGTLQQIVDMMDGSNITVQDVQDYLEKQKETSTEYDKLMRKRQVRLRDQRRRQALKLAQERKKQRKRSKSNASKKETGTERKRSDIDGTKEISGKASAENEDGEVSQSSDG